MKIVILIARLLLGLISVVFGLNGFLNFLSMGPMPTGLAGQFIGALFLSHYYWVVAALQIAGGALLLVNRFVPLALVLLGPVIVNIICYHVFLNQGHRLATRGHGGLCGRVWTRFSLMIPMKM